MEVRPCRVAAVAAASEIACTGSDPPTKQFAAPEAAAAAAAPDATAAVVATASAAVGEVVGALLGFDVLPHVMTTPSGLKHNTREPPAPTGS